MKQEVIKRLMMKLYFSLIGKVDNQRVVILGDFNFPVLRWGPTDTLDASHPFIESINNNFLFQLVDEPTRDKNYLVLVLTSEDNLIQELEVGERLNQVIIK